MPTSNRTIRVFISSTFSDLKAERNALQEHVFPRLKRFCQQQNWNFQAIDLRWGISNEAALDQSTMRICRAEIVRCQAVTPRPNFILLLGDRYGWRPLPDEIPAAEFETLLPHLPEALAKRWYRLDENAISPLPSNKGPDKGIYILQTRTDQFMDFDNWFNEVEGPLGDAFRRAAHESGLSEESCLKYEVSATAQEIHDGALSVENANEHVVAYVREIFDKDGRPLRESLPNDAVIKEFIDLKNGKLNIDSQNQLDLLKKRLRSHLGEDRIKTYTAQWTGEGASTEHIPSLCVEVYRSLLRMICTQIKKHSFLPLLEEERLLHNEFAQRRARDFTGRESQLDSIERYLTPTGKPVSPLVIYGESGSGKSALLAKAAADHQSSRKQGLSWIRRWFSKTSSFSQSNKPNRKLIFRFIGVTANSTDPRTLLEGLCRELGEFYGKDNRNLPVNYNELYDLFNKRLALATTEQPLTLFLDAIDQLQISDRSEITWLPEKLPIHVRLVLSIIPGPLFDTMKSHLSSAKFLELGPMNAREADELLKKWFHRAGRRLVRAEQRKTIRRGYIHCSSPLYLRLAFEEAKRWRSYDHPTLTSHEVDGLIEQLFVQLGHPANHGPLLVALATSFLHCSRHGLSEEEMLELLANNHEFWEQFQTSIHHALPITGEQVTLRLPIVIWSRLYHDLEPYLSWRLTNGTTLMVFFHSRFNIVIGKQFLGTDNVRKTRHTEMASYFQYLGDPKQNKSWIGENSRPFSELLFHTIKSNDWRKCIELLRDDQFVMKCHKEALIDRLVGDIELARRIISNARGEPMNRFGWQVKFMLESESLGEVAKFLPRVDPIGHVDDLASLPASRIHSILIQRLQKFRVNGSASYDRDFFESDLKLYGMGDDNLVAAAVYIFALNDTARAWKLACSIRDESIRGDALAHCLKHGAVTSDLIKDEIERIRNEFHREHILRFGARYFRSMGGVRFSAWIDTLFNKLNRQITVLVVFFGCLSEDDQSGREAILNHLLILGSMYSHEAIRTGLILSRGTSAEFREDYFGRMIDVCMKISYDDNYYGTWVWYYLAVEWATLDVARATEIVCNGTFATPVASGLAVAAALCNHSGTALILLTRAIWLIPEFSSKLNPNLKNILKWPFLSPDPITMKFDSPREADLDVKIYLVSLLCGELEYWGQIELASSLRSLVGSTLGEFIGNLSPKQLSLLGRSALEARPDLSPVYTKQVQLPLFTSIPYWMKPLDEAMTLPKFLSEETSIPVALENTNTFNVVWARSRRLIHDRIQDAKSKSLLIAPSLSNFKVPPNPMLTVVEAEKLIENLPRRVSSGRGFQDDLVLEKLNPVFQAWRFMSVKAVTKQADRVVQRLPEIWSGKRSEFPWEVINAAAKVDVNLGIRILKAARPEAAQNYAPIYAMRLSACQPANLPEVINLTKKLLETREMIDEVITHMASLLKQCKLQQEPLVLSLLLSAIAKLSSGFYPRAFRNITPILQSMPREKAQNIVSEIFRVMTAAHISLEEEDCSELLGTVVSESSAEWFSALLANYSWSATSIVTLLPLMPTSLAQELSSVLSEWDDRIDRRFLQ
jgi:hypothetical protein